MSRRYFFLKLLTVHLIINKVYARFVRKALFKHTLHYSLRNK